MNTPTHPEQREKPAVPVAPVAVAKWSELPDRQPRYALVEHVDLVVIRVGDVVSVLYGRCLHRGALMSDGHLDGDNLICGVHGWDYRWDTGVSEYHNEEVLQKFDAWVDEGEDTVFVDAAQGAALGQAAPQRNPARRAAKRQMGRAGAAHQVTAWRTMYSGRSHRALVMTSAIMSSCGAHVTLVDIQRSEAEPHDIGRPEVADHAAGDQRLHGSIALVELERHLAAAEGRVTGGGQLQLRAAFLNQGNEQVAQLNGLGAHSLHFRHVPDVHCGLQRGQLQDRRGADAHPVDAAGPGR